MSVSPSQMLLFIIIIFVIFKTWVAYRRRNLSGIFTFVWIAFWLAALFLVFQQNLVTNIAHRFGVSRGVDFVIYLSLIAIFYLIYKILSSLDEADRRVTRLVRQIALTEKLKK